MADALLDAVQQRLERFERGEHGGHNTARLLLCAMQLRALLVHPELLGSLGMLDPAISIDDPDEFERYLVKLCLDISALALHMARRVQQ